MSEKAEMALRTGRQIVTPSIKGVYLSLVQGAVIGVAGCIYLFKDLILSGKLDHLWGGEGFGLDGTLMNWIASWGYHILFEQRNPLGFWNANSFYPNQLTLAYSDSLLGLQATYTPLRALGLSSLPALYVSLAAVCIIACAITKWLLDDLRFFLSIETVFIAFAAHFGLSITAYLYHYQLFGFQLAPPFLLATYLYLTRFERRHAVIACVTFVYASCIATYFVPMMAAVALLTFTPLAVARLKRLGWRQLAKQIGWFSFAIVGISLALLYRLQLWPYVALSPSAPRQSLEETIDYSAGVFAVLTNVTSLSFWYRPIYTPRGHWEFSYFPGVILLGLTLAWVMMTLYRLVAVKQCGRVMSALKSVSEFEWFALLLFVVCILLSFGPALKAAHRIKLPFYFLQFVVPGLERVRAPGRFGMMIGLPLAIIAIYTLRTFRRRQYLTWFALTLLIVECLPRYPLLGFDADPTAIYKKVANLIQEESPLLELPVYHPKLSTTAWLATNQLNGSTLHWGRLVSGYGAYQSKEYSELLALDRAIQSGEQTPDTTLDFARKYGIHHVLVNTTTYGANVIDQWRRLTARCSCIVHRLDEETILLGLPSQVSMEPALRQRVDEI